MASVFLSMAYLEVQPAVVDDDVVVANRLVSYKMVTTAELAGLPGSRQPPACPPWT